MTVTYLYLEEQQSRPSGDESRERAGQRRAEEQIQD
jgi:hypothetical protein